MLKPTQFHEYQKTAILHQTKYNYSMLWLDMGLGKTVITLSTIDYRMRAKQINKTLIFGPLRVIHAVWERESRKWEHLKHFRFQIIHGTESKRERQLFNPYADIYLINYENMAWLAGILDFYFLSKHRNLPFQMVVYDEITKVKKSNTVRINGGWKEVKNKNKEVISRTRITGWKTILDNFKYRTGLTGTPIPNGYADLHGQYLVIDGGIRLGKFITHFRSNYLAGNFNGYGYRVTNNGVQQIENQINDITIKMSAKDYLKLPESIINDIMIDLPKKAREQYNELEKNFFVELDDNNDIEIFNKLSLSNKCLQFCNGSPYLTPNEPDWYDLHDAKLIVLEDILEEAAGNPVIVAYTFKSDAERITKKFKQYNPVNLTKTPPKNLIKVINAINNYKHGLVIGHFASMSHGIDGLQKSCHIGVCFGLTWKLEHDLQFMGRYIRQGQLKPCFTHRIMCNNTFDEVVRDALACKNTTQESLKNSVQRYRDRQNYNF